MPQPGLFHFSARFHGAERSQPTWLRQPESGSDTHLPLEFAGAPLIPACRARSSRRPLGRRRSASRVRRYSYGGAMARDVHYRRPDGSTATSSTGSSPAFTRLGVSVWGSRLLEVRGRRSGAPRRTPVNVLSFARQPLPGGASRGDAMGAQPSRSGRGEPAARTAPGALPRDRARGRRERADPARVPAPLEVGGRAVLRRRRARRRVEELARIAPDHPVFRIEG